MNETLFKWEKNYPTTERDPTAGRMGSAFPAADSI